VFYIFREHDVSDDLNTLHGLPLEPKFIVLCMNTDDMLISYTPNTPYLVDEFEHTLNRSYKYTSNVPFEYNFGIHIVYDREQRVFSIEVSVT
jgi:hypothetical protein